MATRTNHELDYIRIFKKISYLSQRHLAVRKQTSWKKGLDIYMNVG